MLTGPNGLLTQADTAKTKTSEAGAKEKVQIAVAGSYGENGFDPEKFETEVERFDGTIAPGTEKFPIKVTVDGQNFEVSEEGVVTGPTTSQTGGGGGTQGKTAEELYDNVNNPNTDGYKETAMHIGDYVDYDAGEWTETKIAPTASNPFEFGGYTTGQSRNENATGGDAGTGKYTGWRIWDITENNEVILISAGCPELYYHPYGTNYAYNSEQILTGSTGGTLATGKLSEPRNWSMYKNGHEYVKEARAMKKSDLDEWYNKYIDGSIDDSYKISSFPENNTDKLISVVENGMYYWLCSAFNYRSVDYVSPGNRYVYYHWRQCVWGSCPSYSQI